MERYHLYERPINSNTETPRDCQIQAMYYTAIGERIPDDIYEAVLNSAERRKDAVKQSMDVVNKLADSDLGEAMVRLNMMALAGAIVSSSGVDGPKAAKRRLDFLGKYVQEYIISKLIGPTE